MSAFQLFLSRCHYFSITRTTVSPVLGPESPDADDPQAVEEVIERVADDEEDNNTKHYKYCPGENIQFLIILYDYKDYLNGCAQSMM